MSQQNLDPFGPPIEMVAGPSQALFQDEPSKDLTLIARDGTEIKCHSLIFGARYPILATKMATDDEDEEGSTKRVKLDRVEMRENSKAGLGHLARYLYGFKLSPEDLPCDVALELYKTGRQYKLAELTIGLYQLFLHRGCREPAWFTVEALLELYCLGKDAVECGVLGELAISLLSRMSSDDVRASEQWKRLDGLAKEELQWKMLDSMRERVPPALQGFNAFNSSPVLGRIMDTSAGSFGGGIGRASIFPAALQTEGRTIFGSTSLVSASPSMFGQTVSQTIASNSQSAPSPPRSSVDDGGASPPTCKFGSSFPSSSIFQFGMTQSSQSPQSRPLSSLGLGSQLGPPGSNAVEVSAKLKPPVRRYLPSNRSSSSRDPEEPPYSYSRVDLSSYKRSYSGMMAPASSPGQSPEEESRRNNMPGSRRRKQNWE